MSDSELIVSRTEPAKVLKKRSAKIILTDEARVLKRLRLEHKLSLRKAAALAGISESTIAHIEAGRMNPPKGHRLERLLRIYGEIKPKSFYERVRTLQYAPLSPREELLELLKRANAEQVRMVLAVVRGLLG